MSLIQGSRKMYDYEFITIFINDNVLSLYGFIYNKIKKIKLFIFIFIFFYKKTYEAVKIVKKEEKIYLQI